MTDMSIIQFRLNDFKSVYMINLINQRYIQVHKCFKEQIQS